MIDFLNLFNLIAKQAKPHFEENAVIDETQSFRDTELDSLDMLMICMYFSIVYGIDDDTAKSMSPINVFELKEFVMANKTQEPSSIEEALEMIK